MRSSDEEERKSRTLNAVRKRALRSFLLGLLITAAGCWYAFKGVDLAAMLNAISHVGGIWIAWSLLGLLFSLVIRGVRWRILLAGVRVIPLKSLVSATFIGFMANNLLPARFGEVVRAWALAQQEQIAVPTVLASILVERLLDVIAALVILGLCLAASPDLDLGAVNNLKRTGLAVLFFMVAIVLTFLVMVRCREQLLQAVERWSARISHPWVLRGLELLQRFLDGLCALKGHVQAGAAAGLSFLIWGVVIASFYVLAEGFGLGLTLIQTTLVFVIVLFGVAIPSTPGFVGTFHGFCVAGLSMVAGTEQTLAAAYATLLHGSQWLVINVVGMWFLLMDRSITWTSVPKITARSLSDIGTTENRGV